MSKELAQTVGGKKIAALFAILAAFAVFATIWHSQPANASLTGTMTIADAPDPVAAGQTITYTATVTTLGASQGVVILEMNLDDSLVNNAVGRVACPSGAVGGVGITWTASVAAGNVARCTSSGALTGPIAANAEFTVAIDVAPTATTVAAPTGSMNDSTVCTTGCLVAATGATGTTVTAASSASPASATNSAGENHVITFTMGPNITCASDADGNDNPTEVAGNGLRDCTTADINLNGAELVSIGAVSDTNLSNSATVAVTISYNGNATHNVTLDLTAFVEDGINANAADFTSAVGAKTYVLGELRHVDGTTVITAQEVPNDVRGHRHTACVIDDATGNGVVIPLTLPNTQINDEGGGGYQYVTDPDATFEDVQITHTTVIGASAATCFSWVSTEAGDQEISVNYVGADDGVSYLVDWDSDDDGNGGASPSNDSLVKEWNVLEESCVTLSGGATGTGCDADSSSTDPTVEVTVGALFNPANSTYVISPITISDAFWGSHVNRTGGYEDWALWGVEWAAWLETTCGTINGNDYTVGSPLTGTTGQTGSISLTVASDASCLLNDRIVVTIAGNEPGVLGSGNGNEVVQHVVINLSTVVQVKQVFLAWAGQRVIVEHDWRLPPGDKDGGTDPSVAPVDGSQCPFYALDGQTPYPVDFTVRYIRQANSPGNFVAGLGATIDGNDEATVDVDNDNSQTDGEDIIGDANGSCISRVLYESEDQGQVNIEAFVTSIDVGEGELPDPLNQTKIAFVIYYMKLESVTVSLVDDVSKPSHNSSASGYRDYSPGNPWDSSKDVDTVDWNVSKDLLVRARVKGWFTTQNATGRAAGTDTNGGVLPAGRWVMPDDWAQLAGGTPDAAGLNEANDNIGLAEAYQPQKDIMIAPNNKLGRSLANPEGTLADVAVTTVAVAVTSSATSVTVASASAIPVNACILIDSEYMKVTSKAGNVLTVTRYTSPALNCAGTTTSKAAHAVGALVILVNLTGVPFEGPYSLLDIPGLAASGLGGAALSNWDSNNIRDTIWGDGDVDAWDAPMPPSLLTVNIRGAGFIKEVVKDEVYYIGTANTASQVYPNPFYIVNIPDSPFIPAVVAGGGYLWDSWGNDGPGCGGGRGCNTTPTVNGDGVYRFWWPVKIGSNIWGVGDSSVTSTQAAELAAIRTAYSDPTIARDLVVYTDNHGEAMVTANGDFKLDYSGCATNALGAGHHCAPGDKVGASTLTAVADYPDFRGKHYPLLSNVATVNWTWGGYKDVTIEDGETEQYKYVVFHAMDRDGFCYAAPLGSVQLHPVYTDHSNDEFNGNPSETVDFMIDSGEGIILTTSDGASSSSQYTKQFAEGVWTYSTYANDPAVTGLKEFPLSSLAATGATDECQAWIKVSNSLLGILDILVIAHDDEGDVGFDKIIDLQSTMSYSLSFRWTLITWAGQDGIATADALKGSGGATNDITSSVTAVYGWDAAAQAWLGYFPSAVPVPGANDLTKLNEGDAYWIAITGPGSVTWTIATNVD
ncbi:MAG: hypothetical protein HS107_14275 [Thermoflexaceae bacterium]|nr:hypothetical protein [Thermoflexaceae bacterium]